MEGRACNAHPWFQPAHPSPGFNGRKDLTSEAPSVKRGSPLSSGLGLVGWQPYMVVRFTKMNGAGNDFVLIDNRDGRLCLSGDQVVRLCHRQRGIGADGLLLLVPGPAGSAEWAWDFFNSDGSRAAMCGNGARCFARFVQRLTGAGRTVRFATGAGLITAELDQDMVTVDLTSPHALRLNQPLRLGEQTLTVHSINTGVPHAVLFVPDADRCAVGRLGSQIRSHPFFAPDGANVNFVELLAPGRIRVRTYERGVEGETLACGTGVTASALIAARLHGFKPPIDVRVQGGDWLQVSFSGTGESFDRVRLKGPAEFVFEGQIELEPQENASCGLEPTPPSSRPFAEVRSMKAPSPG